MFVNEICAKVNNVFTQMILFRILSRHLRNREQSLKNLVLNESVHVADSIYSFNRAKIKGIWFDEKLPLKPANYDRDEQ